MDWDHIQRNWKTMRTNVREKWGELTAKDLDFIAGQRAKLERKIRERYGFAADHSSAPELSLLGKALSKGNGEIVRKREHIDD